MCSHTVWQLFYQLSLTLYSSTLLISVPCRSLTPFFHYEKEKKFICSILTVQPAFFFRATRVESQYKNFWQNLVATFCPLFTWIKGTKCGDQGLSKIFVLWFYSSSLKNVTDIVWRFSTLLLWFFVGCFLCWLDRYMQTTVVQNNVRGLQPVLSYNGLRTKEDK